MIAATVAIVMVFLVVIFFKPSDRHRVVQYRHHDENVCALRPIDKYGNELWYVAPGEEKGYSMTAITENIKHFMLIWRTYFGELFFVVTYGQFFLL